MAYTKGSLTIQCDEVRGRPRCLIVVEDGSEVASVNPYREDWNEVAELFAAAPELYEACKAALYEVQDTEIHMMLDAALAKAGGK